MSRYRQFCGLKPISHWEQLAGLMSNRTVAAYQRLYDTPEDLELFSAGLAENPVPGGLLGPTFTCIIGRQFHNIRVGDRYIGPPVFLSSEGRRPKETNIFLPQIYLPERDYETYELRWWVVVCGNSLGFVMTLSSLHCETVISPRFWYENGGWPSSFTIEQLKEIRSFTMARLLCDNTDRIESLQMRVFVLPDLKINPRVSCRSGVIPRLDLTKWIDDSPGSSFSTGGGHNFFPGFV